MRINVLSLFPNMFEGFLTESIIGKAIDQKHVDINVVNFRDYANNKHNTVDDYPYGGGAGMVLKAEPIFNAIEDLPTSSKKRRVVLMCPQGQTFTQEKALELSQEEELVFICGHYEGYDERIRQYLVTDELSIGDYVLTGGELPAMVMIDAIVRLLPGVLGNEHSALTDSFQQGLLEHPHYTRPSVFRDWAVPDILLSGHHGNIERWRRKESIRRTLERRPELLTNIELSDEDKKYIEEIKSEQSNNS